MGSKLDDTFTKSILFNQCMNSSWMKNLNIDINTTNVETLRSLVNLHQSYSMREIPILLSKLSVYLASTWAASQFPSIQKFIQPKNIRIEVTDSERVCLMNNNSDNDNGEPKKANVVFVVMKNILIELAGDNLGTLATSIKDKFNLQKSDSTVKLNVENVELETDTINAPEDDFSEELETTSVEEQAHELESQLPAMNEPMQVTTIDETHNENLYEDISDSEEAPRNEELVFEPPPITTNLIHNTDNFLDLVRSDVLQLTTDDKHSTSDAELDNEVEQLTSIMPNPDVRISPVAIENDINDHESSIGDFEEGGDIDEDDDGDGDDDAPRLL